MKIKNFYLHLPFCNTKCSFCDFSIYALGKKQNKQWNESIIDKYIYNLKKEIEFFTLNFKDKITEIESIYFGGGTPSLIDSKHIESILNIFKKNCNYKDNIEISLESDPNTFDKEKLEHYYQIGVNRITLGIQSLNEKTAKHLNRSHSIKEAKTALDLILNSKLNKNFGTDLIMGLPEQDKDSFKSDLEFLVNLNIPHLSIYMLSLEKNSSLFNKYNKEYYSVVCQDNIRDMFILAHNYMRENNYEHYEISNFASLNYKDQNNNVINKRSKHNACYWDGISEFYGFGSSAASFLFNKRFKKPNSMNKYFSFVDSYCEDRLKFENYIHCSNTETDDIFSKATQIENTNKLNDDITNLKYYLLNQIRRKEGINLTLLKNLYGLFYYSEIKDYIIKLSNTKQIKIKHYYFKEEEYNSLDFPDSILISDEILVLIFMHLENKLINKI